jgi:hypothetical protein
MARSRLGESERERERESRSRSQEQEQAWHWSYHSGLEEQAPVEAGPPRLRRTCAPRLKTGDVRLV